MRIPFSKQYRYVTYHLYVTNYYIFVCTITLLLYTVCLTLVNDNTLYLLKYIIYNECDIWPNQHRSHGPIYCVFQSTCPDKCYQLIFTMQFCIFKGTCRVTCILCDIDLIFLQRVGLVWEAAPHHHAWWMDTHRPRSRRVCIGATVGSHQIIACLLHLVYHPILIYLVLT